MLYRTVPSLDEATLESIERVMIIRAAYLSETSLDTVHREPKLSPEEDSLSHYLMRVAVAGDSQRRSQWIRMELAVLQKRVRSLLSVLGIRKGLSELALDYPEVDPWLYTELQGDLMSLERKYRSTSTPPLAPCAPVEHRPSLYFRIRMEDASTLISKRSNVIYSGDVIVHACQLVSVILSSQEEYLLASLKKHRLSPGYSDDPTIAFIRSIDIYSAYFKTTLRPGLRDKTVALADILGHKRNIAPCMLGIISKLEESYHLKFHDRSRLSLYLLHLGVSPDEILQYLHDLFIKGGTTDRLWNNKYRSHLLPLIGNSAKEYNMFSCKSLQESRTCTFSNSKFPKKECSSYFERVHRIPFQGTLGNPVHFSSALKAVPDDSKQEPEKVVFIPKKEKTSKNASKLISFANRKNLYIK